jgi:tetratricopeptide (TPR) repeat protein
VLTGLIGLTVWHGLRSVALAEARAAYQGNPGATEPVATTWWQRLWPDGRTATRSRRRRTDAAGTSQPDYMLALQRALDHLDSRPRDGEAARLAALCLSQLDFATQAEPYYQVVRAKGQLTLEELHVRALGLARGNFRDQAIAAYQEILARWPDDPLALQRLAAIYYSRSQYQETLKVASRLAQSREPKWAVAGYSLVGTVHHDEQRPKQAVEANERVLQLDPQLELLTVPAELFFADFAEDLINIDRAADARGHLQRALRTGVDPALINLLGAAYYADGEEDDAEQCWRHATALDPRFDRPWLNLGKLAMRHGRLSEAVSYLETAHAIDRQAFEPLYQLSLVYRRLGRAQDAERFRKKASEAQRKKLAKSGSRRVGMGAMPDEKP